MAGWKSKGTDLHLNSSKCNKYVDIELGLSDIRSAECITVSAGNAKAVHGYAPQRIHEAGGLHAVTPINKQTKYESGDP